MSYIDGVVTPMPTAGRQAYRKHAADIAAVCKEYGAEGVTQCWGDDVPEGKLTSLPMAVQRLAEETVAAAHPSGPALSEGESHARKRE